FDVHTGGDRAFLTGVLKELIEMHGVDEEYVRTRTTGFEQARDEVMRTPWDAIEHESGSTTARILEFAQLLIAKPNAIFVWSMGLTQHARGADTIGTLINIALARGLPGHANRGLVPIRGHSGVQGGAEVGCIPVVDAATAARWTDLWEFPVKAGRGWTAPEMVNRSAAGDVD